MHHHCLSLRHMAFHAQAYKILGLRHNNQPKCPMKDIWYWSHMSTLTTDRNYIKNVCQTAQKQRWDWKRRRRKKIRMTIVKRFALHANVTNILLSFFLVSYFVFLCCFLYKKTRKFSFVHVQRKQERMG